jgi:hypothetical protein
MYVIDITEVTDLYVARSLAGLTIMIPIECSRHMNKITIPDLYYLLSSHPENLRSLKNVRVFMRLCDIAKGGRRIANNAHIAVHSTRTTRASCVHTQSITPATKNTSPNTATKGAALNAMQRHLSTM